MNRYQYLGYIIEKCWRDWIVIDWDMEGYENQIGPAHRSRRAAEAWIAQNATSDSPQD